MANLDLKDRKILYQLDLNCRQSNSQIGKKVGLSKQVVDYRIKKLQDEDFIQNYFTVIDSYKLGYDVYRYYLTFQNITTDKKKEIIDYFVKYKNSWVVVTLRGLYDLSLVLWVRNIPEFYNFWDKTNDLYGDYFAEKIFSIYAVAHCYPSSYLLIKEYQNNNELKNDRNTFQITGGKKQIKIDNLDYKLLNEIAINARIPLIDLANKIECSSQTTNNRIKNLMKNGIIQAFRTNIDIYKLNFQGFKVDLFLKESSKRKKIWNYLKLNPYITFINTSAGYADIEIEFVIENSEKLIEIIEEVINKFPNAIKKYLYYSSSNFHKIQCLPEMSEADFK